MSMGDLYERITGLERIVAALKARSFPFYQTGTWTPTFFGDGGTPGTFTYANQFGFYTRIGNRVLFNGRLTISAISVAPTGNMRINGLPFTASGATGSDSGAAFPLISNFNYTAAALDLTGLIPAGTAAIYLYESFDNAGVVQVPAANFTNVNCTLYVQGQYMV